MKIRWILLLALAAVVILSVPLDYSSANDEESEDIEVPPADDESDDGSDDYDDDDDEDKDWFEIDDITYVPISDDEVYANQCFQETTDVVIPPFVVYKDVTYEVVEISSIFICTDLESITIPYTVRNIERGAMSYPTLKSLIVDEDNPEYRSLNGVLYNKDMSVLITYPAAKEGDRFLIPSVVTGLESYSFRDCDNLREIYLPERIYAIPEYAFDGCDNLYHINFNGERNVLPDSVRFIDECAFGGCVSLTQLDLPDMMMYIGQMAFYNSGLTTFRVPAFIDYIGYCAFGGCKNLESIDANNGHFESIDGVLFEYSGVEKILHTYPNRQDEVYEIPEGTTRIKTFAFMGIDHLKEAVIPPEMNYISSRSFANCESLERITIPESVFIIEDAAFLGCSSLKDVILNKGLIRIGSQAFEATAIETIDIPSTVKYINNSAFFFCKSLEYVDINSEKLIINSDVFCYCESLKEINIYGTDINADVTAFSIIKNEEKLVIYIQKGVDLNFVPDPEDNIEIKVFGKRPYPLENLLGVFVCALILIMLLRTIRGV